MKYIKHIFSEIRYSIDGFLRRICGRLSGEARLFVILSMLLIITLTTLYYTVSLIYNWGKKDARKELYEIRHIEGIGVLNRSETHRSDTLSGRMDKEFDYGWK